MLSVGQLTSEDGYDFIWKCNESAILQRGNHRVTCDPHMNVPIIVMGKEISEGCSENTAEGDLKPTDDIPTVDPEKEVRAQRDAIRSGLKTMSECIAENGGDVEELLVQRQSELAKLDEMNIVVDSDPSATTQSGGSQFKPVGSIDPFGDTLEPTGEDAENVSEEASGNY